MPADGPQHRAVTTNHENAAGIVRHFEFPEMLGPFQRLRIPFVRDNQQARLLEHPAGGATRDASAIKSVAFDVGLDRRTEKVRGWLAVKYLLADMRAGAGRLELEQAMPRRQVGFDNFEARPGKHEKIKRLPKRRAVLPHVMNE